MHITSKLFLPSHSFTLCARVHPILLAVYLICICSAHDDVHESLIVYLATMVFDFDLHVFCISNSCYLYLY